MVTFDVSHNYFQSLPTFDVRLIATGLLQKYLFQGLSAGVRLELPMRITLYSSLGRNERNGDRRPSLNEMYGAGMSNIMGTGLRFDYRYSKFDSSFGKGKYETITLMREMTDRLRIEAQVGRQNFQSTFTQANRALFGSLVLDWFLSTHYYVGGGWSLYRGGVQNYDQTYFNVGYRF